jgi:hypothetical protein
VDSFCLGVYEWISAPMGPRCASTCDTGCLYYVLPWRSNKFRNNLGCCIHLAMVVGEKVVGTLVALSLAKKITVYAVARVYGFPKIYRRLARLTNATVSSPERRVAIRSSIQVGSSSVQFLCLEMVEGITPAWTNIQEDQTFANLFSLLLPLRYAY